MTNGEIVQVLRRTKERLFERDWIKNRSGLNLGPNCILGAISWIVGSCGSQYNEIRRVLGDEDQGPSMVVEFNDADETTFDDVVDFLDSHIKRLEGV